jgi:glycosyltransferase involved in cell wall biosynthesis
VVLEAFASGRRVVASRVGGVPDVLTGPDLGAMVEAHDVAGLAAALDREVGVDYDAEAVARAGARGGWDDSAARLLVTLERAVAEGRR